MFVKFYTLRSALVGLLSVCFLCWPAIVGAFEYKLQFTPNPGYRNLVVAGYEFNGDTVVGNCSYITVHSGSGRGGGYHTVTTYYNQTCTWDLTGNLLSVAQGAPTAPAPLYTSGNLTVYAEDANGDYTGVDSTPGTGGFVNSPSAHYSWQTSNAYQVIDQKRYTFTFTLLSDGDAPLNVSSVTSGVTSGKLGKTTTTCSGEIPVGQTCEVTVIYNPTRLCSPTGLAYNTLTINVASDAPVSDPFTQSFTITLTPKHTNDNCLGS